MNRARLLAAATIVLAAAPAHAYLRSKTDSGLCLHWPNPTGVPVVANVTSGPAGGGCTSAAQVDGLVRSALAAWGDATRPGETQPCTSFAFQYQGQTTSRVVGYDPRSGSNDNIIVFRRELCDGNPSCGTDLEACADQIGCWPHDTRASINTSRTIAITTTSYIPSTGQIVDADMELHDRGDSGYGYYFTCPGAGSPYCGRDVQPTGSCISTDLGSILTHEAGHMLGLDHPTDKPNATMYATYVPGSTGLRILDVDDVNGVCAAYPAGGAPTTCASGTVTPPVQQPKSGGGGCSTAGGGVIGMIGMALVLGARRSRRRPAAR